MGQVLRDGGDDWEVDLRDEAASDEDVVVDLRFGVPGDCPQCGQHAVLVHVDMRERVSRHECTECEREWYVSDAQPGVELREPPARPAPSRLDALKGY